MQIRLEPLTPTSPHLDDAVRVYADTWRRNHDRAREFIVDYGTQQPDFYGFVALDDLLVVGMAFGTRSQPGQWWHDKVAAKLGPDHDALRCAWVLTELAVSPRYRQNGIGTRLHDALLKAQPYRHVLLSTQAENWGARRLYERLGWHYLIRRIRFEPGTSEFVVMHRELDPQSFASELEPCAEEEEVS